MNIIILTNEPFPIGLAGTNRILSYSKNIVDQGHSVKVICLRPTEIETEPLRNREPFGEYEGVRFEYSSGTTIWPKAGEKKFKKLLYVLKGYVNSVRTIKKSSKERLDCLLLYSNSLVSILLFYIVSRLFKIVYIQEKSEYPFVLRSKTLIGKVYAKVYVNTVYKLFDGMIIETNTLIKYFEKRIRKKALICRVPMTVEHERFVGRNGATNETRSFIAYCGNMQEQDGISTLIDAFGIISARHKQTKLYLIGAPADLAELEEYKRKTKDLGLVERVVFTGRISRDEVPDFLCGATILALASPAIPRSQATLPSKLGEYLATANPVVVTKNGEITDYLEDGVSAFLAEPDSAESFAEKLELALSNHELAKQVGLKGREVSLKYFDGKTQAKLIIDFIEELNKCRLTN